MQPQEPFTLARFVNFDEFITGRFLRILYVAGSILIVLGTLGMGGITTLLSISVGIAAESPAAVLGSLFWFLLIVVGGFVALVLWRVYCEIIIIFFKINENVQAIRDLQTPPLA